MIAKSKTITVIILVNYHVVRQYKANKSKSVYLYSAAYLYRKYFLYVPIYPSDRRKIIMSGVFGAYNERFLSFYTVLTSNQNYYVKTTCLKS